MFRLCVICAVALALAGCKTIVQHKADMRYQSALNVCTSASYVPGHFNEGAKKITAARETIVERNIVCDWEAVDAEKHRRRIRRQNALNALSGIYNSMVTQEREMNEALLNSNSPGIGPSNSSSRGQTATKPNGAIVVQGRGYLKRSIMSGTSRVCYYERLGVTSFVRIPSTSTCPLIN